MYRKAGKIGLLQAAIGWPSEEVRVCRRPLVTTFFSNRDGRWRAVDRRRGLGLDGLARPPAGRILRHDKMKEQVPLLASWARSALPCR